MDNIKLEIYQVSLETQTNKGRLNKEVRAEQPGKKHKKDRKNKKILETDGDYDSKEGSNLITKYKSYLLMRMRVTKK
eukprot:10327331-Ditylum_brightwellii.AAC.1